MHEINVRPGTKWVRRCHQEGFGGFGDHSRHPKRIHRKLTWELGKRYLSGVPQRVRGQAYEEGAEVLDMKHWFIPPRCPNAVVKAFRRLVEDEFYAKERFGGGNHLRPLPLRCSAIWYEKNLHTMEITRRHTHRLLHHTKSADLAYFTTPT